MFGGLILLGKSQKTKMEGVFMKGRRCLLISVAFLFLLLFAGNIGASPRAGGTFNWVAPYGVIFLPLSSLTEEHKTSGTD